MWLGGAIWRGERIDKPEGNYVGFNLQRAVQFTRGKFFGEQGGARHSVRAGICVFRRRRARSDAPHRLRNPQFAILVAPEQSKGGRNQFPSGILQMADGCGNAGGDLRAWRDKCPGNYLLFTNVWQSRDNCKLEYCSNWRRLVSGEFHDSRRYIYHPKWPYHDYNGRMGGGCYFWNCGGAA